MSCMVEELVVHLQVVRVRAIDLQIGNSQVLANSYLPCFVLKVAGNVVEYLLLLHGAFSVLISAFLNFKSIQFLVLQLKCEPDDRKVPPAQLSQ